MNIGSGRSVAVIARETARATHGENLGERYAYVGLKRLTQACKLSNNSVEDANLLKQSCELEIVADAGKSAEEFISNVKAEIQENPLDIFHQIVTKVLLMKKTVSSLRENKKKESELIKLARRSINKSENSNTKISLMTNMKQNFLINIISDNSDKVEKALDEIAKNEIHIGKAN